MGDLDPTAVISPTGDMEVIVKQIYPPWLTLHDQTANFNDALAACQGLNGKLFEPETNDDVTMAKEFALNVKPGTKY